MQGGVIKGIKYSELISAFGRYMHNITNDGCCCVPGRGILPPKGCSPLEACWSHPAFAKRDEGQQIDSAPAQPQLKQSQLNASKVEMGCSAAENPFGMFMLSPRCTLKPSSLSCSSTVLMHSSNQPLLTHLVVSELIRKARDTRRQDINRMHPHIHSTAGTGPSSQKADDLPMQLMTQ